MERDIAIIGGGPGGYVAAIRAAQLGMKVVLVEKDKLGGTCLNRGCIPTKALYYSAQALFDIKKLDDLGVIVSGVSCDYEKMQERKNKIVSQLVTGVEKLLKANNVEVINGIASFKDNNTLAISGEKGEKSEVRAKNIIIATGSIVSKPTIPGIELQGVVTSEEMLVLDEIPKRLIIIGGGVIGIEFAGIFKALGSEVSVVEYMPSILPTLDKEIGTRLKALLKRKGISINTDTSVKEIQKEGNTLKVIVGDKKGDSVIETEKILVSTGRQLNVEGLGLDNTGIIFDKNGIKVDDNQKTSVEGIYAIGDVTGGHMLAHVASEEGITAVEAIYGMTSNRSKCVPSCVFTFPEIATVGLTEEEVKQEGINYKSSKFLFGANGKALTMGKGEGFVKVIANENGELLGVHIMGPHASDLIHEATLAINNNLGIEEIINTIHAHPTLAESFHEAILGIDSRAIHMVAR